MVKLETISATPPPMTERLARPLAGVLVYETIRDLPPQLSAYPNLLW